MKNHGVPSWTGLMRTERVVNQMNSCAQVMSCAFGLVEYVASAEASRNTLNARLHVEHLQRPPEMLTILAFMLTSAYHRSDYEGYAITGQHAQIQFTVSGSAMNPMECCCRGGWW